MQYSGEIEVQYVHIIDILWYGSRHGIESSDIASHRRDRILQRCPPPPSGSNPSVWPSFPSGLNPDNS